MGRLGLIGVVMGVVAAVSGSALARPSSNSASFTDPTGDSAGVPDIATVAVENDDAGVYTFRVGFANRTALAPDDIVDVVIDADGDAGTGQQGFEFYIGLDSSGVALFRWAPAPNRFQRIPSRSLRASFASGTLTASISFRDLVYDNEVSGRLVFWVYTDDAGPSDDGRYDFAPDGTAAYEFALKAPLVFERLVAPKSVTGGKRLGVAMLVLTDDETRGRVTCRARLGRRAVGGRGAYVDVVVRPEPVAHKGLATCVWKIARDAKGKTIRGSITVTRKGVTVARSFARRIR